MDFYTVGQVRMLVSQGAVRGVQVVPVPMSPRWYLQIDLASGTGTVVDSQRRELREFSTVEAALSTVKSVGLKTSALRVL